MTHQPGIIAVLCLSLGLVAPARAQRPMEQVEVGAVGGLNTFTVAGSSYAGLSSRSTFYAGLALTYPLGRHTFIEPQLVYAGKGANYKSTGFFGTLSDALRLNYLELPVLLGLKFGGRVQPRLYAGPEIAFNLNCELTSTYVGQPYVPTTVACADTGLAVNKIDVGVTGGGGLAFAYGRGTFSLEARYTLGLTSIASGKSVTNRGLSLGAGYTLPLFRF